MKIVCLGDSLTGHTPGVRALEHYVKWADLLQIGLDTVFGTGRVEVLNQGKAGDTSAGVLAALEERLLVHAPDVVVVLIGANNFGNNAPRILASAGLKSDVREIVARAQQAGIRVLLVQYPVPRAEVMDKVWTHGDAGNPVIAEVAAETGVPVVDLRPSFDAAAKTWSLASLANPVDGIHLNPGGEIVLARTVLEKLRALGWPATWPALPKA